MTYEEAIRLLDPKTTREALAEIEYYGGFSGDAACVAAIEDACMLAVEALKKQIPKKPVLENTKGIVGIDMWHCPVCKDEIISDWNRDIANPYCHHCGQEIDWSD